MKGPSVTGRGSRERESAGEGGGSYERESAGTRAQSFALYAGLAATTCSMLLVQQFLTRAFTILFNSGLAFLAISITFLGLGSAGVCVYVLPRTFETRRIPRLVPALAIGYTVALVAGFVALIALDHARGVTATGLGAQVQGVIVSSLLVLPSMFLVGLVISLVLRVHASRVGKLYGADLMGGGIGCLLVLPLMRWIGGDQGIFFIGALAGLGAALLAHAHERKTARTIGVVLTIVCAVLPLANRSGAIVEVRSHSTELDNAKSWVLEDQELSHEWNELSRLGFFPTRDEAAIYVRIDSSCQTMIPSQDPAHEQRYIASTNFERLPFVLDRHQRYLEIGAGGGRGMVLAKAQGTQSITGVEINPGIVEASLSGFPGFGIAPLVADPKHRMIIGEGRSWARNCGEKFDTVTITFIQTGIASSSAAFALSEANLFTVEAFRDFMGLLDERGLFYVYRHGGNEMLRLLDVTRHALRELGISDMSQHVFVARNDSNQAALLVSRSPFTEGELATIEAACAQLAIEVLYTPSEPPGERPRNPFPARVRELREAGDLDMAKVVAAYNELAQNRQYETLERGYITSPDPQAFVDDYLVDIGATRDDRPYYFFQGLSHWRDFALYFDLGGKAILAGTVILLFWMAAAFFVLVGLLILAPLLVVGSGGAGRGRSFAVIAYFSGLGLGYIAVQISLIQRLTLFLGHPVYALSVVLLAFLLSSGLGSFASQRLFRSRVLSLERGVIVLVVLLALYNLLLPAVFQSALLGAPIAIKVALSMALIFPLAFVMGTFFPHGIQLVDAAAPQLTPWAWGANSATSVVGSILALILAIHFGFGTVAMVAAATYALISLPAGRALRRWASP